MCGDALLCHPIWNHSFLHSLHSVPSWECHSPLCRWPESNNWPVEVGSSIWLGCINSWPLGLNSTNIWSIPALEHPLGLPELLLQLNTCQLLQPEPVSLCPHSLHWAHANLSVSHGAWPKTCCEDTHLKLFLIFLSSDFYVSFSHLFSTCVYMKLSNIIKYKKIISFEGI